MLQTEAKVDSCYPVALEKGHPTSRMRPLHRTASSVQIFIQTTIYYIPTENTVLSLRTPSVHLLLVVGIARTAHFFLIFPAKMSRNIVFAATLRCLVLLEPLKSGKVALIFHRAHPKMNWLWKTWPAHRLNAASITNDACLVR
jgi:hypothetical protein